MVSTLANLAQCYRAHSHVEFLHVPELSFVYVDGVGAPTGAAFGAAVQAVYGVSYAAHFQLRKSTGAAPRVMPLEALWWVGDDDGEGWQSVDPAQWRWRALIMQPDPIDEPLIASAVEETRRRHPSDALDRLAWLRWEEGLSAQVLHIGPYSEEPATVMRLHAALAADGYRPRGRHHEIYLGDPRRCAAERLKTILRQPIEPL